MRNQYKNYDRFNLIELIDEVKTRIKPPFKVDDTVHSAMITGNGYFGTCRALREWLVNNDKQIYNITNTKENSPILAINLEKAVGNKTILSGRSYGCIVRKNCNLDDVDSMIDSKGNINVMVIVPNTVCSINSSFFRGMFKKSIKRFGKDRFKKMYHFACDELQESMIEDGINTTLMELEMKCSI